MHDISVVILTYNEESNIDRTLSHLSRFSEVIIVDSHSTDTTVERARQYPNVHIHQRVFDDHSSQWNFGLSLASSDWILSLDADYIITPDLYAEIASLDRVLDGYYIRLKYCVNGIPLTGSILPPRIALFKKSLARYKQDGHTQLLSVSGKIGTLKYAILHDDRKTLDRWLAAQHKYATLEAHKLRSAKAKFGIADSIRMRTVFAPVLVFIYSYIWKGGFLNGKRGLYYALQRAYVELLTLLRLIEHKLDASQQQDQ